VFLQSFMILLRGEALNPPPSLPPPSVAPTTDAATSNTFGRDNQDTRTAKRREREVLGKTSVAQLKPSKEFGGDGPQQAMEKPHPAATTVDPLVMRQKWLRSWLGRTVKKGAE